MTTALNYQTLQPESRKDPGGQRTAAFSQAQKNDTGLLPVTGKTSGERSAVRREWKQS
jgi:hypothetical protein